MGADDLDNELTLPIGEEESGPSAGGAAAGAMAASSRTAEALAPGRRIAGRYQLLRRIGGGGMGEVWKARDMQLGRDVALKLLRAPEPGDGEVPGGLPEADLAGRLSHPNICRVLECLHADDRAVLVMEYLDGRSLREAILARPEGRLTLDGVLGLAEEIASALDWAHGQDPAIVHGDVKPTNIVLTASGAKLVDFGLARAAPVAADVPAAPPQWGTPAYLAPELRAGGEATTASDVYSFAATLYCALSGRPPGSGAEPIASIDGPANEALLAGLSGDPADRPAGAGELIERMRRPAPQPPEAADVLERVESPEQARRLQELWARRLGVPVRWEAPSGQLFALVPPGRFRMGPLPAEAAAEADKPGGFEAAIAEPFYLAVQPVPNELVRRMLNDAASEEGPALAALLGDRSFAGPARSEPFEPAAACVEISAADAGLLCRWLARREGLTYRLPTEGEWEYAARAGVVGGEAAAEAAPNAWGLLDVLDGVAEWTGSEYAPTFSAAALGASPDETRGNRVVRGGRREAEAKQAAFGRRTPMFVRKRCGWVGVRLVCEIDPARHGAAAPQVEE